VSSSTAPNVIDTQVNSTAPTRTHHMTTRAQNNINRPRKFIGTIRYCITQALISMKNSTLIEPACLSIAIKLPEWHNAMQVNFNALLKNETSILVPLFTDKNVVGLQMGVQIPT
jgi:hypothetical protein